MWHTAEITAIYIERVHFQGPRNLSIELKLAARQMEIIKGLEWISTVVNQY